MPTIAISSFATLLKLGDGATPTESFTTIAEVKDIKGPKLSLGTEEVTAHDGSGWEESIATILKAGDVSFEINFVPTNTTHSYSAGLIKDMVNKTKRNFKLVFPNTGATTWQFAAWVTGFEPSEPVEGTLAASVTLKITGQPTLA